MYIYCILYLYISCICTYTCACIYNRYMLYLCISCIFLFFFSIFPSLSLSLSLSLSRALFFTIRLCFRKCQASPHVSVTSKNVSLPHLAVREKYFVCVATLDAYFLRNKKEREQCVTKISLVVFLQFPTVLLYPYIDQYTLHDLSR